MAASNVKYLRWLGRICGFLTSCFFLLFFIGEGIPDIIKRNVDLQTLIFFALLLIAIIGYIIAIFNEKIGSILQITGGLAMGFFILLTSGFNDIAISLIYGFPFIFCGLIFLICFSKYKKN